MLAPGPYFQVPTVDIGPYLRDPSSDAAAGTVDTIRKACISSGFFQIANHGISKGLQESMQRAAEALFALPLEEKTRLIHPTLTNRGYELIGSQVLQPDALPDLKEGFCVGQHMNFDDERVKSHPQLMGPNVFPPNLEDHTLKVPAQQYYTELFNLACRIMEMLAKGLPYGDDIFVPFMSNDPLRRARSPGRHNGGWHAIEPDPECLVVNIGDMLSVWTNVYKSTVHRVINRGEHGRYSMAFFVDGNTDVRLAPLDGSVPATGKVMTTEEHMEHRIGKTYRKVAAQAI
ncbi:hypothetical protein PG993_009671 [Apiospora rasikravindrae]|uniref:Fe2OG dioxygenase domain-containing protein n=1 Tax=Apiospora rasikravindrae TaxID=990691 RepID=A0ABR1SK17_9PEZI